MVKTFRSHLSKYLKDPEFKKEFESSLEESRAEMLRDLLKETRKNARLTQEELAVRAKMKREAISRIERKAKDLKISTFLTLSDALDQDPSELFANIFRKKKIKHKKI